jgi:hypothetical protein
MYERWLESQPGLFERWGIRYFHRLSRRFGHLDPVATTDEQMVQAVRGVTITGAAISFLIGALSAGGSVLAEILTLDRPLIEHYAWIGGVTLVLTTIEFAVLFVVSIQINDGAGFDDWDAFLHCLDSVSEGERCFLLDLLAVATAFDGKLSDLEKRMLPLAFKEHTDLYMGRIRKLIQFLHAGRLHAAIELCNLDFEAG